MNIYELTERYLRLMEAIEDGDEELIKDLESAEEDLEVKAENYAKLLKNLDAEVEGLKKEISRMDKKKKTIEKHMDELKENLRKSMIASGKTDFKRGVFKFKVCNNGGVEPLVVTADVKDLPAELKAITEKPDSTAIRKYIQETGDLSYGYFAEKGTYLSIR